MFSKKNFSARLKQLRCSKNLSLQSLAAELNVSKQIIGHWETEYRIPPLDKAVLIADFFDVSLDYLIGRSDDPKRY